MNKSIVDHYGPPEVLLQGEEKEKEDIGSIFPQNNQPLSTLCYDTWGEQTATVPLVHKT